MSENSGYHVYIIFGFCGVDKIGSDPGAFLHFFERVQNLSGKGGILEGFFTVDVDLVLGCRDIVHLC